MDEEEANLRRTTDIESGGEGEATFVLAS